MNSAFSLISVVSFNLHGINQGLPALLQICTDISPCVFFVQEHWLSSENCDLLMNCSDNYMCYFSSPMDRVISTGILRGRPYGGVAIMIRNDLSVHSSIVAKGDRFIVVRLGLLLLVNIYASSANSQDNKYAADADLLSEIDLVLSDFDCTAHRLIIGGDFNVDLTDMC